MTVGEFIKQVNARGIPNNTPIYIAHSALKGAYFTASKIELSSGFFDDDENRGILLRANENLK